MEAAPNGTAPNMYLRDVSVTFMLLQDLAMAQPPSMVGHNSEMELIYKNVGIVGTGAMGRGIAQISAQAGSLVTLMDTQTGAAEKAREAAWRPLQRPTTRHGFWWSAHWLIWWAAT
jgi:threonine dehydrogenase-like Zn-dependent dehydrogenase